MNECCYVQYFKEGGEMDCFYCVYCGNEIYGEYERLIEEDWCS